jgi:hypothetical protein
MKRRRFSPMHAGMVSPSAEIMVIHVQRWCAWVLFSVSTHLVLLCAGRLLAEGPTVLRDPDSIHVKLCALFHHSSAVMVERAHAKKTDGTVAGHKKKLIATATAEN